MKIALTLSILVVLFVTIATFNHNLPTWCAHPEGSGNWIVQPLCKGN